MSPRQRATALEHRAQSGGLLCTAGRAFITGQNPLRTGLTKVGIPGAKLGLAAEDPTIAELLKPLGYLTNRAA